jgi:hypothetical protein
MAKTIRRELLPGDPWDAGATEQWLEDRATEGWEIQELGYRFAKFRRAAPRTVRFRCEPAVDNWGHPDAEREALYGESGWRYVGLRNPGRTWYRVWECDDPGAPEIETDPETARYAYQKLLRRQVWLSIVPWLVAAAALAWLAWLWCHAEQPVERLLCGTAPLHLLALLVIPVALWEGWREWRTIRYLRRMMTAGIPRDHGGNWRKNRRYARIDAAIWILYIVSVTAYPVWQIHASLAAHRAAENQPLPCVSYETLRPEGGSLRGESCIVNAYLLEARQYESQQTAWNGERVSARLDVLRGRALAGLLWQERTDRLRENWAETLTVEDPRFDEALLARDGEGDQCLILRRGKLVFSEWTNCQVDLRDHLDDFDALLAQYE